MPIIESAKKRVRVTERKTAVNNRRKKDLELTEKDFLAAVEAGDVEKATELFNVVQKKYHQAEAKNILHKNKASRIVSRYNKMLNAMAE